MSKASSEGQATESSDADSFECYDPMACAKATKEKKRRGRKTPSAGCLAVVDCMCKKTDLFAKQWTELQRLIANSENARRLSEEIKVFYGQMDQKADRKRQELQELDQAHPPHEKENAAGVKATLKEKEDLQKSLVLTIRKICECAKGVSDEDDEEKCRRAAEFVEEVLSEFKRMHFAALAFVQRCFLYACPKLWSDREAVMAAVQQDGLALQMAPGELKNNQEVVIAAVRNNSLAWQFASNELLSDVEVEMAVHDNDVQSLENSPEWFFTNTLQSNDMRFAIDIHRNHVDLCNSTSLAELLDKSSNLEQALKLLEEMEKSAEGDPRLQTRRQQQGDDPYSLKELIASKRKQIDIHLKQVDNKFKDSINELERLQSQLAPYLREEQIQQSREQATRQLKALWQNKMNPIRPTPHRDFTISTQYLRHAVQESTKSMVEAGHWEENRVEEIFTEFRGICRRFQSLLEEDAHAIPDCSSDPVGFQTYPYLHSGGLNYDAAVRRI
ncbi:unnamed protein product [Cladocopium goreaui]|uniref:DUF4116 domain-containing protein n=1 Tax=Cladocopium goreaui TaxID=2562237 RepID=A0A9P1DH69_9DINO|nr:unnamed protein product [Cladocopium goreaui]